MATKRYEMITIPISPELRKRLEDRAIVNGASLASVARNILADAFCVSPNLGKFGTIHNNLEDDNE
jgi:hypothetical protein